MVRLFPGATSGDRPALAAYNKTLYLIWRGSGTDYQLYTSTSTDNGATWSAQVSLPQTYKSKNGPCLIVTSTSQHLVYRGASDDNIYYSKDLSEVATNTNFLTSERPAIFTYGNILHLVWKGAGNDTDKMFQSTKTITSPDNDWSPPSPISSLTPAPRAGPSMTRLGNVNFLAYTGTDGALYVSKTTTSDTTWDTPVATTSTVNHFPIIVTYGTQLIIMSRGGNGNNQLYFKISTDSGTSWTSRSIVNPASVITTTIGPGFAATSDSLHLIYVTATNELNYANVTTANEVWNTLPQLARSSSHTPVLAGSSTNLLLYWKGVNDTSIYRALSKNGGVTWTNQAQIDRAHKTTSAPAFGFSDKTYHLFYRGRYDNGIYYLRSADSGKNWTFFTQLDGETDDTPAVTVYGNTLYLSWKGSNENKLYWSKSTDGGASWIINAKQVHTSALVQGGPTLLFNKAGDRVHLVYRGETSSTLYYTSCTNGVTWNTPYSLGVTSPDTPGLAFANSEKLLLVWKGPTGDNTLWQSVSREIPVKIEDWSSPVQIDNGDVIRTNSGPAVVNLSDTPDNVRVIIRGQMGTSDNNFYRVNGTSNPEWASVTKLSTTGAGSKALSNARPYITSMDGGYTLSALWKGLNDSYVYMSTSTDSGMTWTNTPTSINTAITTNYQPYLFPRVRGGQQHLFYCNTNGTIWHAKRTFPGTGDFNIVTEYAPPAIDAPSFYDFDANEPSMLTTAINSSDNRGSATYNLYTNNMVSKWTWTSPFGHDVVTNNTISVIGTATNFQEIATFRDYQNRIKLYSPTVGYYPYNLIGGNGSDNSVLISNMGKLYVFWKGVSGDPTLYWAVSATGKPAAEFWTLPESILPTQISTNFSASVYAANGSIYLLYTGVDNEVYYTRLNDGVAWQKDNYGLSSVTSANWMEQLYNQNASFGQRKLAEILIPGTHRSAQYEGKNFPTSLPCMKKSDKKQNSTISQQLSRGIRYFDLSFDATSTSVTDSDDLNWEFTATSTLVDLESDILQPLKDFLATYPKEIVILHISQWGSEFFGTQGTSAFKAFFKKMRNMIGDYLMPRSLSQESNAMTLTIEDILKSGKRVIISVERPITDKISITKKYESYLFDNITSPYDATIYNSTNPVAVKKFIEAEFPKYESKSEMWVSKLVLTPELKEEFLFHDITHISSKINSEALSWLTSKEWKGKINIVSMDFCWDSLIETMIRLNMSVQDEKDLPKEDGFERIS